MKKNGHFDGQCKNLISRFSISLVRIMIIFSSFNSFHYHVIFVPSTTTYTRIHGRLTLVISSWQFVICSFNFFPTPESPEVNWSTFVRPFGQRKQYGWHFSIKRTLRQKQDVLFLEKLAISEGFMGKSNKSGIWETQRTKWIDFFYFSNFSLKKVSSWQYPAKKNVAYLNICSFFSSTGRKNIGERFSSR